MGLSPIIYVIYEIKISICLSVCLSVVTEYYIRYLYHIYVFGLIVYTLLGYLMETIRYRGLMSHKDSEKTQDICVMIRGS